MATAAGSTGIVSAPPIEPLRRAIGTPKETWLQHTGKELWRMRWPVVMVLGAMGLRMYGLLNPDSPLTVLVMKMVGPILGGIIAHIFRSQLFGYIKLFPIMLGDEATGAQPHPQGGQIFLGIILIYASFVLAGAIAFGV